jgi:hydroxyacylglutathione hydrolase
MLKAQGILARQDNYIWLIQRDGQPQVAIVDPTEAAPVLAHIQEHGLEPVAILITHHHWDHVGGIAELVAEYPMPVYGPARETIPHMDHPLDDGDEVVIEALDCHFRVMDVAGHTAGHIAYLGHGMLFIGDTLFAGGCGRIFEGTPTQMQQAMSRIRALPDDTQIYCAHEYTEDNLEFARVAEPDNTALAKRQQEVAAIRAQHQPTVPSQLGLEKATNPFLRYDEPKLIRAAEDFVGHPLSTEAEVFAAVRYWKDTLD